MTGWQTDQRAELRRQRLVPATGTLEADISKYLETLKHKPKLARDRELRRYHGGFAVGRDYRLALSCTKVAPCLVRRSNRDGHVMRTFERPPADVLAGRVARNSAQSLLYVG